MNHILKHSKNIFIYILTLIFLTANFPAATVYAADETFTVNPGDSYKVENLQSDSKLSLKSSDKSIPF